MQVRNVCFTLNNYTAEEYEFITAWDCKYMIVGKEVGESGTPHLQGYVEFNSPKRMDTLKKMNKRIHWEARKGTAQQASDYCMKDDKEAFIKGKISKQGERKDIDMVADMITEGKNLKEIAMEHPTTFIKFHKGIEALHKLTFSDRTEKPTVKWIWGLAGRGKTYYCTSKHESHYIKDGTMWWNEYEQQEAIIIDDFDGKWPFRDLLRLLDRYKYQGQYKGGYVKINSPFIYITCEFPPEHYWDGNALEQVTSRLTEVVEVTGVNRRLATEVPATEVTGNTMPSLPEKRKKKILFKE